MFLMLVFGFLSGFHGVFSATHSLKGYFTLSAGLSVFPDFVAVGIVDEDTVGYFDSSIKRLQLRPQWAENIEGTFTDKEILERKVPPEVSLLQRDPSSPVTCLATGFFPKGIVVSWEKDGEDLHEDVELLETVPNEDGTFQTRSRLTVSPADLKKHKFTCIVDHISLERKIIKPVTEEDIKTNQERLPLVAVIVGVVVAVLFFLFISAVAGVMLWRNRRANALQGTDLRDLRYEVFNIGARQCVLSASDSFSDTTSNSTIPIAQGNSI
ncbi:hypothetical protein MATL_G00228670 [Megalops atlanticus]|uniref:Ig-like domain-containing protein n=1 Tax=Megalops atlanticus TaxID=7932 RepID=A0A9D3SXV0_MEGAT|nr:hypothetical protein MATL_G00228670 [Megalops atlanticus]